MEQTERKIHPGLIIGGIVAFLVIVIITLRSGGSITGERPANDVSQMIPTKREQTLPPPPGFNPPTDIASFKKANKK